MHIQAMAQVQKRVTSHDVARRAGVSQATVSYVLSGRRSGKLRVSEDTRQRVMAAVQELGYVPNQTARALRRQRTERVCLMLSRVGVPSYDQLVTDVQRCADQYGYTVIIAVSNSPEREQHAIQQIRRGIADALLIPYHIDPAHVAQLAATGLPLVVMSNQITPAGFDVVRTTEATACDEAMNYLVANGHRRIAFLNHRPHIDTPFARYESYVRVLQANTIPLDPALVRVGAEQRGASYRSTCDLLALPERPTAIFASSDIGAISAINAIQAARLRVPEDIAVVGVGNIPEGAAMRPRLTTVGQEPLDFGAVAQLLFDRLQADGMIEDRELVLPWRLIVRDSV
jgi:DNA-binding LacI/PurR family transcriptional regulator